MTRGNSWPVRIWAVAAGLTVLCVCLADAPATRAGTVGPGGDDTLRGARSAGWPTRDERSSFPGLPFLRFSADLRQIKVAPPPKSAVIRHPRPKNRGSHAMPAQFVAAVWVNDQQGNVTISGSIAGNDGMQPADAKIMPLKSKKQSGTSRSRHFVFVKPGGDPTKLNPYTLTFDVAASGTRLDKVSVVIDVKLSKELLTIDYPYENNYPITGDELSYFVPSGQIGQGRTLASITIDGVAGSPQTDSTSDPSNPVWWAEFFNLSAAPGPGSMYSLVATDDNTPMATMATATVQVCDN